jgi:hypothetical protein
MRNLKLRITSPPGAAGPAGGAPERNPPIAFALANPGHVLTVEITGVPDDVPDADVVYRYTNSIDLSIRRQPATRAWQVPFDQIGPGRILG